MRLRKTSTRLERLAAHCRRTKWRDPQAREAYWTLRMAQPGYGKALTNLTAYDKILREHYRDDVVKLYAMEENVMLRFITKRLGETRYGEGMVSVVRGTDPDLAEREGPGQNQQAADFRHASEQEPGQEGARLRGLGQGRMSRIIEEEVDPPIRSKAVSKSYREGYDSIDWGPDEEPAPPKDEGYQLGEMDPKLKEGLDEIQAKIRFYANYEQPVALAVIKDVEPPRYSCEKCCDTGCIVDPDADESTFVTEADGLINCDECSIRGKQLP